jgi:hypothetical protein
VVISVQSGLMKGRSLPFVYAPQNETSGAARNLILLATLTIVEFNWPDYEQPEYQ